MGFFGSKAVVNENTLATEMVIIQGKALRLKNGPLALPSFGQHCTDLLDMFTRS